MSILHSSRRDFVGIAVRRLPLQIKTKFAFGAPSMDLATKLFIRVREVVLRRRRAQAVTEYMLIIGLIVIVFLIMMAVWAEIQNDPD